MWRKTVLAAVAVLSLAACGGSSASPELALKAAAQTHTDAINDGDLDRVKQHMSTRCLSEWDDTSLRETLTLIHTMYGEITLKNVKVTRMNEKETSAHVEGTSGIEALDQGDSAWWVYENGTWRADDC